MQFRIGWKWAWFVVAAIATATIAIVLFVWKSGPDMQKLTVEAQTHLQAQLDTDFTPGVARVLSVELVKDGGKFDGSGQLLVLGKALILPFVVVSNEDTTLVTIPNEDMKRVQDSFQGTLSSLRGQYSSFILEPRFRAIFPKELVRDIAKFKGRLETVSPISEDYTYYYGQGCKAHRCTSDEAAWVVEKKTAHLITAIWHVDLGMRGASEINAKIDLYGKPKGQDDLPPPLESWKSDLTDWFNSAATSDGLLDAMRGAEAGSAK